MSRHRKGETMLDDLTLFQIQNRSRLKKKRRELRREKWQRFWLRVLTPVKRRLL